MSIMGKRGAAAALVLALAASGAALAPQSAMAEVVEHRAKVSKKVVTKAEYRRIKKGMAIAKVHRIFGTSGKQSFIIDGVPEYDIADVQQRSYKTPSKYGTVSVTYERLRGGWKVDSKMAFWGI